MESTETPAGGGCDAAYRGVLAAVLGGERVTTGGHDCLRAVALTARFRRTPLVAVRAVAWKTCLREMEWFVSGSNDLRDLHPSARPWWEPWADVSPRDGSRFVAFNYARQLRAFHGEFGAVDQVAAVLDGVAGHPFSRRNVATTWHAADMLDPNCPITNCWGTVIQFHGHGDGSLTLQTYQRSADVVCGVPHNWLQMWGFFLWVCSRTGRAPREMVWHGGDCHVYAAHEPLARRLVATDPPPGVPELVYTPTAPEFRAADFSLGGEYCPAVTGRAEMVV